MCSIRSRVVILCAFAGASTVATTRAAHAQLSDLPLAHWQHTMWTGRAGPPVQGPHLMLRSSDGYLWLGAYNSLVRFDGVRFTVLDSTTVPALRPRENGEFDPFYLDAHGVMWISGPGGAGVVYKDGRFRAEPSMDGVAAVVDDLRGLIVMKDGKPYRLQNGQFSAIPLPAGLPASIWSVRADTGDGLWIGTRREGLWRVSRSGAVRQYAKGEVRPLIVTRDGTLWATGLGVNGAARLDGDRWITLRLPNDSATVLGRFAQEDGEGSVWFQTNAQGVIRYRNGVVEAFTQRNGLSDDRVRDVQVDPSGVVWVTTDAGLDRLRPASFATLDPTHLVSGGSGLTTFLDRGGGMWLTSRGGRRLFFLDGGILRDGRQPLSVREYQISKGEVVSPLAPSPRGGVWVRPRDGDLIHLQPDGTRKTVISRRRLPSDRIVGGIETRDGAFWIDSFEGFGRFRNGEYRRAAIEALDTTHVDAHIEDGRGRMWVSWGDQPSLAVFDGDSVVANVTVPTKAAIEHLALEHGDTLWAVSDQSLFRIIGETAVEVRAPALRRVLAPRLAIAIAGGSLWVSSTAGIARVSLADLHRAADGDSTTVTPQIFDALDGVEIARSSQMDWQSIFAGPDGRVWVNTAAGLAVTNPTRPSATPAPPRVLIEEVTIDGVTLSDSLRMPAKPGRLDIHFTATDLELPERARLAYRLDGADNAWVQASIPRVATYNHLRPGNYVFRVRAWNDAGVASTNEATLRFRVPPAWDQAWWFFALVGVAIAGAAAATAVAWQRRRSRLAADRAQARFDAMLAERTRVARELHDTLLGEMAGVAMQLKAGAQRFNASNDGKAMIVKVLSSLSTQVQRSLVEARRSVTAMRAAPDDLLPLHKRLESTAQRVFAETSIAARVEHAGSPHSYAPTVEAEILGIATEAMTNARQHANCQTVTVSCTYARRALRVSVRDDGRGFDPSQATPTGHWGLIGMRERAASIGASLEVRSTGGEGTEISLVLPGNTSRSILWTRFFRFRQN